MLIGSVEIHLNHRVVRIGSKEPPVDFHPVSGAHVSASDRHVHVVARAQSGLVRVKVWNRVGPVRGTAVFDGDIFLADGCIAIGDVLNESSFVQYFGSAGLHRVRVSVDDQGNSSRVDVILDPGVKAVRLTSVDGYAIPYEWTVGETAIGRFDELGLILSLQDLPVNRLSAALKIISIAYEEGEPENREYLRDFGLRLVSEWLRWLREDVSDEVASEMGCSISVKLRDMPGLALDEEIRLLASEVIESLHGI
ncbi:hypothetical protein [Actinacidiphila bryophytorum]|uniref:hypothetical protein n=1 Tax=Actinacidiphila bryophytorum TaxID=1436133 RepID=UPI002176A00B|nr:hypothetical protein [Actinacidiphila bryophytorum]UWE08216.1 hypothetical protein NYE86_05390 [Actinacidiphila bryophytorum]